MYTYMCTCILPKLKCKLWEFAFPTYSNTFMAENQRNSFLPSCSCFIISYAGETRTKNCERRGGELYYSIFVLMSGGEGSQHMWLVYWKGWQCPKNRSSDYFEAWNRSYPKINFMALASFSRGRSHVFVCILASSKYWYIILKHAHSIIVLFHNIDHV